MLVTQDAKMVVSTRSVNNDRCNKYGIIANIYFFLLPITLKLKVLRQCTVIILWSPWVREPGSHWFFHEIAARMLQEALVIDCW